jgi:hypothetical protein
MNQNRKSSRVKPSKSIYKDYSIDSNPFCKRNVLRETNNDLYYDINLVQRINKNFASDNSLNLMEVMIAKDYEEIITTYHMFNNTADCKFVSSTIKCVNPKIGKYVCNVLLENNPETKGMNEYEKRSYFKELPLFNFMRPRTLGDEYKIYELFANRDPKLYRIFMEKKFSTSLHNVIVVLNKISHSDLMYVKKNLYCHNGAKWTCDSKDLIQKIKNLLFTYFNAEAMRTKYKPNLTKLHEEVFIKRILKHYKRYEGHRYTKHNINFNNDKKEYIFFSNLIFGAPKINTYKAFFYDTTYFNTLSTNYEYKEPKKEEIQTIKSLLSVLVPEQSIRSTLVNFCCLATLYQTTNILVVFKGNQEGKNAIFNLMLAMLGDYGTTLDSQLITKQEDISKQVKNKRLVVLKNYNGNFIDNEQLANILEINNHSTYFLDATTEPHFKKILSYHLCRKIVEINIVDDVDNSDVIKFNNQENIKNYRCAIFKCLLDYFQNTYKHHTCNNVWYRENVDMTTKLKVTKYQEYNHNYDRFLSTSK